MRKILHNITPWLSVILFGIAAVIIHHKLRQYHYHDIAAELRNMPARYVLRGNRANVSRLFYSDRLRHPCAFLHRASTALPQNSGCVICRIRVQPQRDNPRRQRSPLPDILGAGAFGGPGRTTDFILLNHLLAGLSGAGRLHLRASPAGNRARHSPAL